MVARGPSGRSRAASGWAARQHGALDHGLRPHRRCGRRAHLSSSVGGAHARAQARPPRASVPARGGARGGPL
eukprot:9955236-Lingulodinium_polyedra.AAC.1